MLIDDTYTILVDNDQFKVYKESELGELMVVWNNQQKTLEGITYSEDDGDHIIIGDNQLWIAIFESGQEIYDHSLTVLYFVPDEKKIYVYAYDTDSVTSGTIPTSFLYNELLEVYQLDHYEVDVEELPLLDQEVYVF